MSETLYHQDYMASDEVTCYFCPNTGRKADCFKFDVDEPGNTEWACEACYEKGMLG